jgi:hypothetical protein
MVERNVLGSNLMSFLDAVTSVIIGPLLSSECAEGNFRMIKEE